MGYLLNGPRMVKEWSNKEFVSKAREKAERERKIKEIEEARARVSLIKIILRLFFLFKPMSRAHPKTHLSSLQSSR